MRVRCACFGACDSYCFRVIPKVWMLSQAWRGRRASWRRGAATAAVFALVLAALAVRLPVHTTSVAEFPHVSPARLAHLLADFSHRHTLGQWMLEAEKNNYTSWQYSVRYLCGARCEGRAAVEAHEVAGGGRGDPLTHGARASAVHRVRVTDERCESLPLLPLLPWPRFCEETVTDTWVSPLKSGAGEAAGARMEEGAAARCGAFRVLRGACADQLRTRTRTQLQRLREALHAL